MLIHDRCYRSNNCKCTWICSIYNCAINASIGSRLEWLWILLHSTQEFFLVKLRNVWEYIVSNPAIPFQLCTWNSKKYWIKRLYTATNREENRNGIHRPIASTKPAQNHLIYSTKINLHKQNIYISIQDKMK